MSFVRRIFLLVFFSLAANAADPKLRVEVLPTEDRWITFGDGSKLFHGIELTTYLANALRVSGKFVVMVPQPTDPKPLLPNFSAALRRVGRIRFEFSRSAASKEVTIHRMPEPYRGVHVLIRPRIETLLYSSGERSNRLVFGFSPETQNFFNGGKQGYADNEFTAKALDANNTCPHLDFFGGRASPLEAGPLSPNFGADFDEGISFAIAGFGFTFKQKKYEVKSEFVFDIRVPELNQSYEFRHVIQGKGKDLWLSGLYKGIGVSLELQRRKTLRKALDEILPRAVADISANLPMMTWFTKVVGFEAGRFIVVGGNVDGLTSGTELVSTAGARFRVVTVDRTTSTVDVLSGQAAVGDLLRPRNQGSIKILSATPHMLSLNSNLELPDANDPADLGSSAGVCFEKNSNFFDKLAKQLSFLYGLYRYKKVFDQPFTENHPSGPKVAIVSSGVYPKESSLRSVLDSSGYDYLSLDDRPSDDLGMGTAAALMLRENVSKPMAIIPIKVLGPHGETHSGALYAALTALAKRRDVGLVMIPFKPTVASDALIRGVTLLVKKGKKVVLPDGISIPGAVTAGASDEFQIRGLSSAHLRLAGDGAGVVLKSAQLLNNGEVL